ncbi:MAG: RHS repeat-associated core domain-containing protein [Treponema sp.]|nr:RHS repeat-associated core domain-containing protein [Treponema sp.]
MVWREHYTYDGNGNLIHEAGTRRQTAYEYNGQNRMVYAEVRNASEQVRSRYEYDALGRRTIVEDEGGSPVRTLYDGVSFEVVRSGVIFNDGQFTMRYSSGIQWDTNRGTEGSRYRWVSEGENGIRTRSTGEYNTITARYEGISVTLYGNGEPVAVSRSASEGSRGGPVYLGKDILGSVKTVTGEYGTLEDRYEYDAFGKPYTGDLTQGMNLGYTGKPYDTTTGMYNYGYRDYQPELARFTTIDPIRDGSNWFAYVNNDPVNWRDPWGLSASESTNLTKQNPYDAIKNFDIVTPLSGDLFGIIELNVVTPLFGFEISISAVLDLDHPLESGLNFSGGLAANCAY